MPSTPIFQVPAEIISNRKIGPELYWMDLLAPDVTRHASPGHFVHISVTDTSRDTHRQTWLQHTPLLRRPFSIAERDPVQGVFGLIYRVVGGGTDILAGRSPGEQVDVLGPLGQVFNPVQTDLPVVMVAGGVGVAPFLSLVQETIRTGQAKPENMTVLFGAATTELLSGEEKFQNLGVSVRFATDDGTRGHHGFVTSLLEEMIRHEPNRCAYIYVCGPTPMMRIVQTMADKAGIPGQVSLEGIMPCGVGVCMACVVPCITPDDPEATVRYERVCYAGPVFDIREVVLI